MERLKGKDRKACGGDGIWNWMIRRGGEAMEEAMLNLVNLVWEWEVKPRMWNKVKVIYLYKGKGARAELDNYRPVSLLSCVGKFVTMVWRGRL